MKILLIQPPMTIYRTESKKCHPPLGLAYLAATVRKNHTVVIVDALAEGFNEEVPLEKNTFRFGLSFKEIKKRIQHHAPDIIGISFLFSAQAKNIIEICSIAKEVNRNCLTVVGGAHVSAVPEEVLKNPSVDLTVIGEGEAPFARLCDCLATKEDFRSIPSIGFKENGKIIINPRHEYETNLDAIPFPAWDLFPLKLYFAINNPHGSPTRKTPFFPIITSRGCPFSCIFCSIHNLWGRNYRTRSAENVLQEIAWLKEKFQAHELLFEDDNLTLDANRAMTLFQGMIAREFNLLWSTPNGVAVQTLTADMLTLMQKSGCYRISISVESGDKEVLDRIIKKPVSLPQIKPIVKIAKKLGMETVSFFVVGLPGEKRANLHNTLRFARGINTDYVNFFFATPLPGTRLLTLCKERGLIKGDVDFTTLKSDYPCFDTEYITKKELYTIIFHQRIVQNLLYLVRNPGKFFSKVHDKLLRQLRSLLKRLFTSSLPQRMH